MKAETKSPPAARRLVLTLAATTVLSTLGASAGEPASNGWLDNTISPVVNPIFFEDPRIGSEVRPIFMEHYLPSTFHFKGGSVPLGGDVQVFALQLRYAVSDRLAIIATKDGYIDFRPDNTLSHSHGWADLAAGLKYALIDDRDDQFIVTPGFTITAPSGSTAVFQGRGAGEWNLFVSAEKGCDKFHTTANIGFRLPNDWAAQTAQSHYSLQFDYFVHQYFIPFVAVNGYTVLSQGDHKLLGAVPLNAEMYDLINFGATDAQWSTQVTVGGGVRSRLTPALDLGASYEVGVVDPKGIFQARVTADMIWRF